MASQTWMAPVSRFSRRRLVMQPVRTTKARPGSPSTRLTANSEVRVESQARSHQTAAEEQVLGAGSGDWQGSADS